VDRADPRVLLPAQVVHRGLDVLGRRAQRDEHGVRVLGLVAGEETVVASGQPSELLVRLPQEAQDRLGEVVPPGHDTLHVVFLVLHGPEQHRVGEVDHPRNPPSLRAEEGSLGLCGAVDEVVRRAQELADERGLVPVEGPLEVRGQEAVLDVHPGGQAQLGDASQDERLVGGLLRVLGEDDDPPGVERAVDVVVPAVHVEGVLGEGAGHHLEHHRGALAGGVVVLLDAVDDPLP
jgi:hypothetical protein